MSIPSPLSAEPETNPDPGRLLTDFTPASPDLGWYVVNDNVMGGRSQGGFEPEGEALRFAGRTNTNGGGFSSIRTKGLKLDLSAYDGIRVRVKGDGRRYTWRLTTDARRRGRPVSYWADFETRKGEWTVSRIPFTSFKPQFRGFKLAGPKLDPARISGMGLMIYDKRDGPFELRLDSAHAYRAKEGFSLSQYRSKKRVLVLCAPGLDDERLRAQRADLEATREDFDERDIVLVLALTGTGSAAGGRKLTTREASAVRATVKVDDDAFALRLIGKDGSVKHSASKPVSMQALYTLIDTMPMRRAEARER